MSRSRSASLHTRSDPPAFEHVGPRVGVLTRPDAQPTAPSLLRGTIPPGAFVPLHSHAEVGTFRRHAWDARDHLVRPVR